MKKRNAQIAAFIAAVTVSASFLPGCQKGKDASTDQAKMNPPAASNRASEIEDGKTGHGQTEPTCIHGGREDEEEIRNDPSFRHQDLPELTPPEPKIKMIQRDPHARTESKWPSIELSGDPRDVFTVEEDCFYEGDRYFIFFREGAEVHGDAALLIEQTMKELEETFGMSYDTYVEKSDYNWRYCVFDQPHVFDDVNRDTNKINIIVDVYGNDGVVQSAHDNAIHIYEEDLLDSNQLSTLRHELMHTLQLRNSHDMGQIFTEGLAVYAEYLLAKKHNEPEFGTYHYLRGNSPMCPYDEEPIFQDPEGYFFTENEVDSGIEQREYQFGFRLITYLVDTYGISVISKICLHSTELDYEYGRTDMYPRIIKDLTSPDVFQDFAEWLPKGWDEFAEAYYKRMEELGYSF